MIRVLIVDDHAFIRRMVAGAVRDAVGMSVVGECADGATAVTMAAAEQPHVVVLDVQMPGESGLAVAAGSSATSPQSGS